jgi:TPR repeat protein
LIVILQVAQPFVTPAAAQRPVSTKTDSIAMCELLADSPEDPGRSTKGVTFFDDASRAVSVCEQAVKENPSVPEMMYDLSRALRVAGKKEESRERLLDGVKMRYAAALTDYGVAAASDPRPDYLAAVGFLLEGAEGGSMLGWSNLGLAYMNGLGVKKDLAQGVALIRRAADGGSIIAERTLGVMYLNGKNIPKDASLALTLLRRASDSGDPEAAYYLGCMALAGIGLPVNRSLAEQYFELSASRKNEKALAHLADGLLTAAPNDPASAARAREYYLEAAKQGDAASIRQLIWMDLSGVGGNRRPTEAVELLQPLAAQNDAWAMTQLASCYRRGDGAPWDETRAMELFQKAGNLNDAEAQSETGRGYMNGFGNDGQNYKLAADWLTLAANKRYAPAELQLGYLYQRGWGVSTDRRHAYELYSDAEVVGDAEDKHTARRLISSLDSERQGVSKDLTPGEILALGTAAVFVIGMLTPSSNNATQDTTTVDSGQTSSNDYWDKINDFQRRQLICSQRGQATGAIVGADGLGCQ